jgi:hypothetical protein
MMLRLTWAEFVQIATEAVQAKYPDFAKATPMFMHDYGGYDGGIKEGYEVPMCVDFEVREPKKEC